MDIVSSPTNVFVGLDYHTKSVQMCVLDREGKVLLNRSCGNDQETLAQTVSLWCGQGTVVQAAIESCCGADWWHCGTGVILGGTAAAAVLGRVETIASELRLQVRGESPWNLPRASASGIA